LCTFVLGGVTPYARVVRAEKEVPVTFVAAKVWDARISSSAKKKLVHQNPIYSQEKAHEEHQVKDVNLDGFWVSLMSDQVRIPALKVSQQAFLSSFRGRG